MLPAALALSLLLRSFSFYAHGPYDPGIPKPEAVLGYGPGEHETTYHLQEEVVRTIAAHSKDRVLYIPYGKSTEGKTLRVLAITSPANMKKLAAIRADIARLAEGNASNEDEIIRRSPAIVWVNECIHGDEPASFEDAMWLLYNLAASRQPEVEKLLDNCVVILNPSYNPDGHERFVVWYNSVATGSADRESMEHREPPIVSGRLNHYRFDMNRDRVAMSQAETRQEVAEFLRWNPQAYADQHGQVQTYFFPPASLSVNVNVDRSRYNKWAEIFGHATGSAFDHQGFAYYVKDVFDLYYPGYLDSWTTLNGAIGMTHETDAGYALNSFREDGSSATLRGAMARHFTSAMAVIQAVSDHREEILRDYAAYRKSAVRDMTIRGNRFVTLHSEDPKEIDQLQTALEAEGIRVLRGTSPMPAPKGESLWGGQKEEVFASGTWMTVALDQPQGHLVKTLFEAESDFEPEFIKEQLRRRAQAAGVQKYPGADPAEFYDVTAWNLAYANDLDAWLTPDLPSQLADQASPVVPDAKDSSLGFIARPSERASLAVAALLEQGVKLEVSTKALTRQGRSPYPPGSFIIYRDRNGDSLDHLVNEAEHAQGGPQMFEPLNTSYPVDGREGAGSESVRAVARPHIGVVFGDENAPTGFGAVWFAMERTFKIPFTPLTRGALSGDLSGYSCLVFPRGQYPPVSDKLREWIDGGGCAVVFGPQNWVMNGLIKLDEIHGEKGATLGVVPGSLFRAELDPRSFLSYGYQPHGSDGKIEIAIPVEGNGFYKAKPEGGGAVVFSSEPNRKKLLSGWEWPDDTEKALQGAVWVHDQPVGRGHVILFMSDPTERAMWPGMYKLFLNAILLGSRRSVGE